MSAPRKEWETWPMFGRLLPGESVLYTEVDVDLILPLQQWLEYERGVMALVRPGRLSVFARAMP